MRRGRSTAMRCFNSPSRAECPAAVIGILVIEFCSTWRITELWMNLFKIPSALLDRTDDEVIE
jgi:hypothetical protein